MTLSRATHLTLIKLCAVAAMLSLAASACGVEDLPTTPNVSMPSPSPAPAVPGYRVSGHVHGPGKVPIAGALVAVVETPAKRARTDSSGFFELDGLAKPWVIVDVTAEGYWPLRSGTDTLTFDLTRSPLASGTYTLTISAGADCRRELPEAARTRTYAAVVGYDYDPWDVGPYVVVTLSGANFRVDGRGRHGGFYGMPSGAGDSVVFVLVANYNSTSPFVAVVEQLTPSTALVIAGSANMSGTLNGELYIVPTVVAGDPDYQNPIAVCRSNAHQFVLSR
jgi:hypothetical protein